MRRLPPPPFLSRLATAQGLKEKFNATTAPIQGSGWGWLAYDKNADKVTIVTRPNQDVPETLGVEPLLGVDVWEHAYCAFPRQRRDPVRRVSPLPVPQQTCSTRTCGRTT